ncbi:unnamed protein product [Leptidea sinapis]|uniref:Uncharacterized protein n=1 Tax=Leptidea sinapis TaxID=189913 RepID=A0A5E4QRK4_9NEOP|nr:unnamed protein product [Leptidea sinapis]
MRPRCISIPVGTKFYAAHDQMTNESREQTLMVDSYSEKVSQARAKGPRSKYPSPCTDNQIYGWYDKPLLRMDRNDRRFYQPKKESEHTKVEIIILMSNPRKRK